MGRGKHASSHVWVVLSAVGTVVAFVGLIAVFGYLAVAGGMR